MTKTKKIKKIVLAYSGGIGYECNFALAAGEVWVRGGCVCRGIGAG